MVCMRRPRVPLTGAARLLPPSVDATPLNYGSTTLASLSPTIVLHLAARIAPFEAQR
jgi:hypothetical protein